MRNVEVSNHDPVNCSTYRYLDAAIPDTGLSPWTYQLLLFWCSSSSFSMALLCLSIVFFLILRTIQLSGSSLRSIASVSRFMCLCMQFCCMQIFSSQCQIHRQETAMVCSVDFSEQSNCFNQISKQTVCLDSTTCHFIRDYLINILGCQ